MEALDLTKIYVGGDGGAITVLDGVNLQVSRGQMVAVVGASGTGKSTLLQLLGALDKPTRGTVNIAGQSIGGRGDDELSELRNRSIGFVFQFHHLLREFTARENVMMPLRIAGWKTSQAERRADDLLARVGLGG
ncbi:MAG TPA: ATP-binding cassette domain-containing protein, partial [Gemmatimonadaceae bacterium]